ncbi:Putative uncharacterized transposon-derived protein, partial [Frankliniella fusca]
MAPAAKTHKAVLQVLQSAKPKLRKAILENSDKALVFAICEICDNLLRGNIPLSDSNKAKLKRHRHKIRELAQRGEGWTKKKERLQKGGAFLPLLLSTIASVLPSPTPMNHVKKMILVPHESVAKLNDPTPPASETQLSALDNEMELIMRKKYADDSLKWKLYNEALQRYLHFNNERKKPGEDAYTLHKPARRRFPRNVTYSDNIDESWHTDLTDFQSLKKYNDGFSYILCVIDVFSKYGWAVPIKDKSGPSIIKGFQTIFKTTDRRPTRLFSDKGKEYINKTFQKFLKENNITYIHTHNPDIKCSIVE